MTFFQRRGEEWPKHCTVIPPKLALGEGILFAILWGGVEGRKGGETIFLYNKTGKFLKIRERETQDFFNKEGIYFKNNKYKEEIPKNSYFTPFS